MGRDLGRRAPHRSDPAASCGVRVIPTEARLAFAEGLEAALKRGPPGSLARRLYLQPLVHMV